MLDVVDAVGIRGGHCGVSVFETVMLDRARHVNLFEELL